MTHSQNQSGGHSICYCIVVCGELSSRFESAFPGMTLHARCGQTTIIGHVADQTHLHNILGRLRNLAIDLISVTQLA